VSDDTPQPATPEPDPFEQLLKGLAEPAEPAAPPAAPAPPAPPAAPAQPETRLFPPVDADALPPTVAMTPPTAPTVALPPAETPAAAAPHWPAAEAPAPAASEPGWSLGDTTGPTALFPAAGATAATTVLPGGAGGGGGEPPRGTGQGGPFGNRRVLLWILGGVAGLLVIALAVLLTILAMNGSGASPAPTQSPTGTNARPTPSKTATRTPSPTPTVTPGIKSFVADPMVVSCESTTAVVNVKLSWATVGATQIAVASAADMTDALDHPYQNNLGPVVEGFSIPFACGNEKLVYTLTIAGADKEHRSSVVTVTRLPIPTPTPTPTPPPAPPAPTATFGVDTMTVSCTPDDPAPRVVLEWTSSNGTSAAIDGPGSMDWPSLQPNGTQPFDYDCNEPSMTFTLTVTGPTAPPATAEVTVTNEAAPGPESAPEPDEES